MPPEEDGCEGSLGRDGKLGKERLKNESQRFTDVEEPHFPSRSVAFAVDLF